MFTRPRLINSENDPLWKKHCSFLDLTVEQFIAIQERKLLEQLQSIGNTTLERRIIGENIPSSVDEFREKIPLTTYGDYLPELGITNEDTLPEKPYVWAHTSGQGTAFLDIPYTFHFYNQILDDLMAVFILSCSSGRGESSIQKDDRVLYNAAPSPYLGGLLANGATQKFPLTPIYSPEMHDELSFSEKIAKGFEISLKEGVDITIALTSVLVKMGKDLGKRSGGGGIRKYLYQPSVLYRLVRGYLRSKIAGRDILPQDLWPMKALIGWGMDTNIYRDLVYKYWGKYPFEFHACTEAGIIGMQSWTRKDMTFVPYTSFLEFIPESEIFKRGNNNGRHTPTLLLSELEAGNRYEMVITNFHRMPFVRYRLGHMVKITALSDEEAKISLPQMTFEGRADELIDIASFTRLSERTISKAIANLGIGVDGWTIRKEVKNNQPGIVLYIEPVERTNSSLVKAKLHTELKKVDLFYDDLDSMMDIQPIDVHILNPGTFARYQFKKEQMNAELAQLKPPKINASDEIITELLSVSRSLAGV